MPEIASEPSPLEPRKFRSPEAIDAAILKLRRRIQELEQLDVRAMVLNDSATLSVAKSNVRETLREVFGVNSPEYREHGFIDIWDGPMPMGMSVPERIQGGERGRGQVIGILNGLVGRLEGKKADFADSGLLSLRLPSSSNEEIEEEGTAWHSQGRGQAALESLRDMIRASRLGIYRILEPSLGQSRNPNMTGREHEEQTASPLESDIPIPQERSQDKTTMPDTKKAFGLLTLDEICDIYVQRVLARCGGNCVSTAKILGINLTSLDRYRMRHKRRIEARRDETV